MSQAKLFLLHGWGLGRAVWTPCLPTLQAHGDIRLHDLPGYGAAAADTPADPAPAAGADGFLAAARAFADALPPGSALCGWSLGALLAVQAALLAPERVGRLILIGATPCFACREGWTKAQPPTLLADFASRVGTDARGTLQRFVALFNQGDANARAIGRGIARDVLTAGLPDRATLLAGLDWLGTVDLRARVADLACPVLLVHGARDPLMPLAAAEWLAAQLPRARLDVFAEAGHAPFLSDPARFTRLASEFLHAD